MQLSQKCSPIGEMNPTVPNAPAMRNILAGPFPTTVCDGCRSNVESWVYISCAETYRPEESGKPLPQSCAFPIGINSMKRICQSFSIVSLARAGNSSALSPRTMTAFNLMGVRYACSAAAIPLQTRSISPPRVMRVNLSRSSVSRLMFTRRSPASARGCASLSRSIALVVRLTSSISGMDAIRRTISKKVHRLLIERASLHNLKLFPLLE